MDWKRRKEITRDINRYLASRKRTKIDFKKLFRMPIIKPMFVKEPIESKKEESYYEKHAKQSQLKSFFGGLKKMFWKKPSEEYIAYQSLAETPTEQAAEQKPEFASAKRGWFKEFTDIFRPSKEPEYVHLDENVKLSFSAEREDSSLIKDDLKEVAKIALNTLKSLPKNEIEAFKKTESFTRFKDILKRYNLIK